VIYSFSVSRYDVTKFWWEGNQVLLLSRLNFPILSISPKMLARATTQPFLIHLSIFGALVLQIKRGQIYWKANISGYNFYEEMFPKFCRSEAQISSKTGVMNLPRFCWRFLSEFSANLPSLFLLWHLFSMFSYILWFLPFWNHELYPWLIILSFASHNTHQTREVPSYQFFFHTFPY
jgi:hypothetical protein